jgi:DNA-binding GntR family transcriptional regulator
MAGRFAPGALISIRTIADRLGTSAMPAREALNRLIAEGALERRPNRTIAVPLITRGAYQEIRDIRVALEGLAAEQAAPHLTDPQLDRLEILSRNMRDAIQAADATHYLASNQTFHFTIYAAAGNVALLDMIEKLWLRVGPLVSFLFADHRVALRAVQPHNEIVNALRRRDGAAARAAIQFDITDAADHICAHLPAAFPEHS